MTVFSVLVPYRPDGGHRDLSWAWIERRWHAAFNPSECELLIGGDDGGESPAQFNHPLAINRLAAQAAGDVFIIADADTAFDPWWIRQAVFQVREGAPWVLPVEYRKLTEEATAYAITLNPVARLDRLDTEWIGNCEAMSGQVVVPRTGFDRVRGYDERFRWWGADDRCFAWAMDTLWGEVVRLPGACYHLWHPQPLDHTQGHREHRAQHVGIVEEYEKAAGNVTAMRKMIRR
jgi:hypothetical protein